MLMSGAKNQARILKGFATTPTGPFQTVDRMIASGRSTARRVIGSTGMKGMKGQKFLGRKIRRSVGSFNALHLPMVRKARSRAKGRR